MPKSQLFKETVINAGSLKSGGVPNYSFELNDASKSEDIEWVNFSGCGSCVQAAFNESSRSVNVTLNVDSIIATDRLQKGVNQLNKVVEVKVNDGTGYYSAQPGTKRRIIKPGLSIERLTIIGSITVD